MNTVVMGEVGVDLGVFAVCPSAPGFAGSNQQVDECMRGRQGTHTSPPAWLLFHIYYNHHLSDVRGRPPEHINVLFL